MPIRRHQDPHYEVSPAPQPLPMPIRRHQDPHHVSLAENAKHRAEEVVMKRLRN